MLFPTTCLTALIAATATLFPSGALAAGKGCRQCDCHITFKSYARMYKQDDVSFLGREWVHQLVANGDFEQFTLGVAPGATCNGDFCDKWQAWFKAWRLCSNGSAYSCAAGNSFDSPAWEISCSGCTSVQCGGDCDTDCSTRPYHQD
jgi:hypothetical protein